MERVEISPRQRIFSGQLKQASGNACEQVKRPNQGQQLSLLDPKHEHQQGWHRGHKRKTEH